MPPPEQECMLWAQRLVTKFRAELDEALKALPTRYPSLLQDSALLDSLKGNIEDLTAASKRTDQTMQAFYDRIQELESEAALRDRENGTRSELTEGTARDLARQLEHTIGAFDQFKREVRATAEERAEENRELRKQIDALRTARTTENPGRPASKPASEAATRDDSPGVGLELLEKEPPHHEVLKISQGRTTYEEYVKAGEKFVGAAVRQTEMRAVKAVVSGMRQAFQRKPMWKTLEEKGWTWSHAKPELQKIVNEGKRRRANRRTIEMPSLKEQE
ncbi:MAG: hypothetical protein LQ346_004953 [Caloplaca aetnensis]|nr:MAG: hypothetical protein LQ346_004953 [Caloplaca aetnensis]